MRLADYVHRWVDLRGSTEIKLLHRVLLFCVELGLGVAEDIFAGAVIGQLQHQVLAEGEALAQAGVDLFAGERRGDVAVNLHRSTTTAIKAVGEVQRAGTAAFNTMASHDERCDLA